MLKSCQYCGKIHDSKYDCGKKPKSSKRKTSIYNFHRSAQWTAKSIKIRERDHYLCQCCMRNMAGTMQILNYKRLSVHHIIPIEEDWEKRLDDDNLITLCDYHHEQAESGRIEREMLIEIVQDQMLKEISPR